MIEPIDFGGALRRSWRLLLICAVVFAVVAVLVPVGHAKPKAGKNKLRYESTAVIGSLGGTGTTKSNITNLLFWANEYSVKKSAVRLAGLTDDGTLEPSMTATIGVLGGGSAARPGKAPRVTAQSTINLGAGGTTSTNAVALANSYANAIAIKAQQAADNQAAAQASSGKGSQPSTTPTTAPATPYSGFQSIQPASYAKKTGGSASSLGSSRKIRGLAGAVIGLLVGAGIVLAREVLDKRIHTAGRAERTFKYPVVVQISDRLGINGQAHSATVLEVVDAPDSAAAEAYRMLRMSVLFEELAAGPPVLDSFNEGLGWQEDRREEYKVPEPGSRQVILVVSAADEESRPKVAANLSATYAEAGQHVIVISTGDITSGYAGPLANGSMPAVSDVGAHLVASHLPNVSRLSLRPFVGNGGQLVTHAPAVLQATRQLADVTILESPPLLGSHHAEALVHSVDVVLVVGECAKTTMAEARKAGELLRRLGAPVLGVVLTKVRPTPRELRRAAKLARANRPKRGSPPEPERALVDPQVVPEISPPVWESSQA